jgi:hypothetical protein
MTSNSVSENMGGEEPVKWRYELPIPILKAIFALVRVSVKKEIFSPTRNKPFIIFVPDSVLQYRYNLFKVHLPERLFKRC